MDDTQVSEQTAESTTESTTGALSAQDRIEIAEILSFSSHLLDNRQWDMFGEVFVPGVRLSAPQGEFDGPAMLPLIAPRPLLVINGDLDGLTPLAGVQESAAAAEQAYRLAHAQDRFELFVQPDTGHTFTPHAQQATVEWFVRWLKP